MPTIVTLVQLVCQVISGPRLVQIAHSVRYLAGDLSPDCTYFQRIGGYQQFFICTKGEHSGDSCKSPVLRGYAGPGM